ncbi:MAG: alpha/beta fold hydrolase [Candidatus Omnitrophica bacterium]|nr:alpha/beta fold hydrolase [Candidatus Omnitrophota bacterium]
MIGEGDFKPAWWCRSAHAQTIWASTLRPIPSVVARRERWETPDGDFLDVDHVPAAPGRPLLIILHGLEGSSHAKQAQGLLHVASGQGWRGLGINFRSCSGSPNRLRRSYHAGETSDLSWVLQRAAAQYQVAMCCVGMSLGGNVLLKYLGEARDQVPDTFTAAVAISTPFDLAISARAFEQGVLNRLYMRRLLRSLKQKTLMKLAQYPDLVDRKRLVAVRTIREFDELVTAPVHGFANATEYWRASSCLRLLPSIRRPTLLINAIDDPLVPFDERLQQEVERNRYLTAAFPSAGGHGGFVGSERLGRPIYWAEQQAIAFFQQHLVLRPHTPFDAARAIS